MASVLAVATVLAAGLTVLPTSVQEAQANPCSIDVSGGDAEGGSQGGGSGGTGGSGGAVSDLLTRNVSSSAPPTDVFDEDYEQPKPHPLFLNH